jgi:nicotinamidase-related amidase
MPLVPQRHLLVTFRERILPEHTAVIVVDMQNDYVSLGGATHQRKGNIAPALEIVPRIKGLLTAARDVGALVILVQMTMDADLRCLSDAEYLRRRVRWGDVPCVVEGSWGHEIVPELAPQPRDLVVSKNRSSAFIGTNLDLLLRSNRILTTIVTGTVTNGCVNSTARGAMLHDYNVAVVSDCVASSDRELHDATLMLLRRQLELDDSVVPAQRIIDEWATLPRVGPAARELARRP